MEKVLANRAAIFVDAAYLHYIVRDQFGAVRIDYAALARHLAGDSDLLRTYYYDSPPYRSNPPTQEEEAFYASRRVFFEALERIPRFAVRLGRVERRGPDNSGKFRYEQKRVDTLLGIDLVLLAAKQTIQEAIIVAGDSDFIPAVSLAKAEGVLIRLYHGPTYHRELWQEADERIPITQELVDAVRREDP